MQVNNKEKLKDAFIELSNIGDLLIYEKLRAKNQTLEDLIISYQQVVHEIDVLLNIPITKTLAKGAVEQNV
ncbi:MAG: hypothetical protein ACTSYW_06845 [Candidatus Heimdallarchaeota archaeon]